MKSPLLVFALVAFSLQSANREPVSVRVGLLRPGGGYTVITMTMETYVAKVLAGEAARDSRPAALEALAIAIRTFAQANRGRHRADGFDVCDQTHCQVVATATAATERAAESTAGRLLLRNGSPASIYYTASCGGHTETPSAVWPGAEDPPFLPSREDDACQGAPAWIADLHEADILRALHAAGFRGARLADLRVVSRTTSGRVAQLALGGMQPAAISGQDLRVALGRTMGWQHLKSTAFELRRNGEVYRFTGRGSGHGVGLCVIGSARLAEQGQTAEQILARYYPGLEIVDPTRRSARPTDAGVAALDPSRGRAPAPRPAAADGFAVLLPDEDEGAHAAIERQARIDRDRLARTLGVPTPPVTFRFHATMDEYEHATGHPWFSSPAMLGGEIHLVPVVALRDRGMLDQDIRRGLVHLMVDGPLGGRPAWVREGAALYYAEAGPATPPAGRISCPSDSELKRPVSAGALSNALSRAKGCFAKQIGSGKTWKDVR